MEGLILQIPEKLIREAIDVTGPQSEVFDTMALPWAVLYRKMGDAGALIAAGFGPLDDEQAKAGMESWLEANYRDIDVTAVLHKGRPVRFNLRVKARIG